jgi:copper chaperone CopZ
VDNLTSGLPSVEAIAIPPVFAVRSVEVSLPRASVTIPTTRSLSLILSSLDTIYDDVPPTVMFPPT